jgi:LacI family transcriptional regulator
MSAFNQVTLKDIAREANVSIMTVSRALRNQPNLSPDTRAKVQAVAEKLGYRPHPLVSALMSYRRAAKRIQHNVSLAFITSFSSRTGWRKSKIYTEFFEGAAMSADRHGYKLEEFWLREPRMSSQRLSDILYSRNISGVIIAPLPVAKGHMRLDWDRFSSVAIGYSLARPVLHRAVNHQFRSLMLALRRIRKMGYRRWGLALPASFDERVDHHWMGSFMVQQTRLEPEDRIPAFVLPDAEWTEKNFARWFRQNNPDVIISQQEEVLQWLKNLGLRVPDDVGFVHLNCPDRSGKYAGIVQNNFGVGVAAVDFLVGMIFRNERGIPEIPHSILVEGTWQDGETLRKAVEVAAA